LRPPTKTLRIFSALSLMSVTLCLPHFSPQKATAQGSTAKDANRQSWQTKPVKLWHQTLQSGGKQAALSQSPLASTSLAPVPEASEKPAATARVKAKTLAAKTLANQNQVTPSLVTTQPNTKPYGAKPVINKPGASVKAAPNYANKAAREAEKKIQDHDLAAAVNVWSTELESRPENADSWVGRASVKRMIGDYHGAQDDLDRALEINANNVPALISRAAVLRRLADLRGAAKDIDRAVELAPKSYQAFAERSSLRFALNDMQGAMADYNYAITLNPDLNKQVAKYSYSANSQPPIIIRDARDISKPDGRPETKTGAANKAAENKTAESKAAENKSAESKSAENKSPDDKTLADNKSNEAGDAPFTSAELAHMNNTGVHEINAKHFAVAIKTFERLLEISPNYAHAKENLVIAHNNFGLELSVRQPKEALKQFRAALYLDPRQAAIRKNLSAIMRENGQDPASTEDRLAMANECLLQGEAEGAFVELSEALRIKNTPQLREKLLVALAAINSSDSRRANHPTIQKEKLEPKLELNEDSRRKASAPDLPPPTILGTILPAIPESPSTMTTIADLPNATIRNREAVAIRPVRAIEEKPPTTPVQLESPSATPGYDAAFVKSTLDNTPETVLQVARQLASENRELDAEALLNRLGEILRKKSLKGDKTAEQMLELTLETLSELYFKSNRLQNAEPTLRELVAIREKTKSPDDHILGKTLAEYSMVLKSLGRGEEAAIQEQKANFILNQLSAH
jgi:tetratricopeptide (TPR) repeat protein